MRGRATVRNFRCDVAFRCDRCTHTQAGPVAVTVGLFGELGYVGIEAERPRRPRRFSGGLREPVEIPGKLAEVVRCRAEHRAAASRDAIPHTMRSCPSYLRLRASLTMPLMTGKTNVRPVDGPAVTDRDKH